MSRKQKSLLYLAICLLSAAVFLILSDFDIPNAKIAFRIHERKHMIGPAEIVDTLTFESNDLESYDRMMLGKSAYGYTVFRWLHSGRYEYGTMSYHPKDGKITAIHPFDYESRYSIYRDSSYTDFLVCTEYTNAVRATMTMTLVDEGETSIIRMEANKEKDCYFLFQIDRDITPQKTIDALFAAMHHTVPVDKTATAVITLFDQSGKEIESKTVDYTRFIH